MFVAFLPGRPADPVSREALLLCCRTVASRQPPDVSSGFASDAGAA